MKEWNRTRLMASETGGLRILMIVFNRVGKGTYWRALHLGRYLARRGHDVTLLATSARARMRLQSRSVDGVRLIETPDWLPGGLRSGWDAWASLRRVLWVAGDPAFDIVHAFEARPAVLLPALAARGKGATLVMDWCDWFGRGGSVEERQNGLVRGLLRPPETFFEERFRPLAQGTTVINTVLRDKAIALGVRPETIRLMPNGADLEHIAPADRTLARDRLGLPAGVPIIAYTGALFWQDAELMAAAFDHIHAARSDAQLLLIGYCNIALERMVRAPAAVRRTGPVDPQTLADYLAASDLGWLPLRNSGADRGRFPMKLGDYMAAGLPVAATDVGDVGDLFRREPIGTLCVDEPQPLADAVLALLRSEGERARCGQHARGVAESQFNWACIAQETEAFYQCIGKRRS